MSGHTRIQTQRQIRRRAVEGTADQLGVWLVLVVASGVGLGCKSSHDQAPPDAAPVGTATGDGAVNSGCPELEPVEGTACAVPGLACGGFGTFSCPETAICAAEGRWGIVCPEFDFGSDSAVCGCPHPGGVGVTVALDASASGDADSTDAQIPLVDRSSCRWPADSAVDSYTPQPGACTAGPMFGICTVPNGGTVEADGTILAPDGAVVTGTCQGVCTPDQYTLNCLSSTQFGGIPAPDLSLGCNAIGVPTPSNALYYCCPCAK